MVRWPQIIHLEVSSSGFLIDWIFCGQTVAMECSEENRKRIPLFAPFSFFCDQISLFFFSDFEVFSPFFYTPQKKLSSKSKCIIEKPWLRTTKRKKKGVNRRFPLISRLTYFFLSRLKTEREAHEQRKYVPFGDSEKIPAALPHYACMRERRFFYRYFFGSKKIVVHVIARQYPIIPIKIREK